MSEVMKEAGKEIVTFDKFEAQLIDLEKDYGTRVYDLTDSVQETAARSDRLKIAKVQSAFNKVRLKAKEEAQKRVNHVNQKGKVIDDRMEAVKQNIKGQLDKRDQELKEHAEKLQSMVDEITDLGIFITNDAYGTLWCPTSEELTQRLDVLKNITVDNSYEDRKADATLECVDTKNKLDDLLLHRVKIESEQADLKRLKEEEAEREQAEREEKIRKEATEKAEMEAAEQAEIAQAEIDKIKGEKAETEAKAEEEKRKAVQAERERIAKEAKDIYSAQEKTREDILRKQEEEEEKERIEKKNREEQKADKAHRKMIEDRVLESFRSNGPRCEWDEEWIVDLIKDGKIENVSINY